MFTVYSGSCVLVGAGRLDKNSKPVTPLFHWKKGWHSTFIIQNLNRHAVILKVWSLCAQSSTSWSGSSLVVPQIYNPFQNFKPEQI